MTAAGARPRPGRGRRYRAQRWTAALDAFVITFEGRPLTPPPGSAAPRTAGIARGFDDTP
ncbi:hypothetical protein SLNWT_0733 [Streptomyces albus]|uniref:Uncharacterized protein n=1 Tax=Streptomyces albus (strain ATCC 21838 / DSM 41398 / FERM P-419 / JCM 4703 / NBRC 107858) TaxID=1081613 RepID=A0A0B5EI29_STRA4|nr:hypothetical protein SLNWT_0733 [Streptomyces albus]AOU75423.1 hypothetical protein SLNHY_0732 [Streptomyces albus]AYN31226.1 hypothetical protein DUI70_0723 [Streptomyces albus]